jgi:hypothetical protein
MPLTGAGVSGATGVTVEIQGKIDDITKKLDILDKDFDKFAAHNREVAAQSESVAKKATMSWTDFRSMYSTVLDAVRVGQQVWENTGAEFIKYADSVRDVSRSLGSTTEEASRLIQVADDVFISYDKLTIAMKMAQKQGIDPSIEGLAKLADKYLSLAPGVERTQFLLKTFGKSGAEMGKLMEKGGEGIRKMSAGIEDNLILTKKATDEALKFKQAQDKLNDSIQGLKVATGSVIVPFMDAFVRMATVDIQAITSLSSAIDKAVHGGGLGALSDWAVQLVKDNPVTLFGVTLGGTGQKLDEVASAASDAADATGQFDASVSKTNPALDAATKALDDYKNKLEEVSQANKDAESFIQSYADFQKGYAKDHAAAVAELGKATLGGDAGAIADAKKAITDLEATWHESTNKMIYDMVLTKVSVDGLTDAEFKATQDLAVSMGIRTQADADAAKAAMDKASAIADGIAKQEDVMRDNNATAAERIRLEDAKKAAADSSTAAVVDGASVEVNAMGNVTGSIDAATRSLVAMGYAASQTAGMMAGMGGGSVKSVALPKNTANTTSLQAKRGSGRDSGGSGIAGEAYMIGTGAQPEAFIPSTNGTFVPNADKKLGGTTINIYITNPKKETAENSIRAALQNISYLGVAQ